MRRCLLLAQLLVIAGCARPMPADFSVALMVSGGAVPNWGSTVVHADGRVVVAGRDTPETTVGTVPVADLAGLWRIIVDDDLAEVGCRQNAFTTGISWTANGRRFEACNDPRIERAQRAARAMTAHAVPTGPR